MAAPDTTFSSDDFDEYPDLATAAAGVTSAAPAREIMIVGASADSTLILKQLKGGTQKTMTVPPLVRIPTACVGIVQSGSTLASGGKIQVYR